MATTSVTNKKAFRDYFLSDNLECGIELHGGEVKSIRGGYVNFKDSFARIEGGEVLLYSLHVTPYKESSYLADTADRPRKLLLHKKEIMKLQKKIDQQGVTLIPTKLYFNKRGFVKIEIALGKGKKMFDKRETVKKRNVNRDLKRMLKNRG
ncbi:MAG: SsrA-binding protein SmpB [Candidatus Omnitrophica bacterium]|nr:SsrA-binding protein SmpB [Candidatus Omnitrophota bacterium]